jgi:membrane protease YdiL (CAAX protease family)
MATKLDHRTYEEYGLTLDAEWGLDFAIGVAITTLVVAASILWGVSRGIMEVNAGGTVTDGGALSGNIAVIIVFVGFFLTQNVYEELVYRGIVIQNFMEGLVSRGISPAVAVVPVTVVSTSLFGLFHLPLRGSVLAVVDAAVGLEQDNAAFGRDRAEHEHLGAHPGDPARLQVHHGHDLATDEVLGGVVGP